MAQIGSIIAFTYVHEGGLSRSSSDSASANAAPFAIRDPRSGEYKTGWHTNKGITYPAFLSASKQYGFPASKENFEKMPHDIWLTIAKRNYWDKVELDSVNSQSVANILFSFIWGAGYGWTPRIKRYVKRKGVAWSVSDSKSDLKGIASAFNSLVSRYSERVIVDDLISEKKAFLLSLNQPKNEKGWLNRLDKLREYSYTLMSEKTAQILGAVKTPKTLKSSVLITLIFCVSLASAIYFAFISYKTKI